MGFITIFHHLFGENIFFGGTFSRHPRSRDSFVSWLLWRFPKSKTLPVVIACWGGREDACLRSPQENRCSKRRLCLVWNIFFSKFCRWVHCVLLVLWSTQIYHIIIKNQGHTFACFYLTLPCLVYIRLNYITLLCCVSSSLFFFPTFCNWVFQEENCHTFIKLPCIHWSVIFYKETKYPGLFHNMFVPFATWVRVIKVGRTKLGGGFKYSLFSSLVGEDSHFD